jgi:hypothetical protein
MTLHRLPAGTDVAEMALFDIDAMPQSRPPDREGLARLAAGERLVRLPTGADGGYLLHLYVDEPPPEAILRFCRVDDPLAGHFSSTSGRVAFGGLESTFRDFAPNPAIRSDARIAPGRHAFTAYHTEIPDELIEQAMRVEASRSERVVDKLPVLAGVATFVLLVALLVLGRFLLAGLVFVAGTFVVKSITRSPAYRALAARRDEAQLDYPSIVIELRSVA